MTRSLKKFHIIPNTIVNKVILKKYNVLEDLNVGIISKLKPKLKKKLQGKVFFLLNSKDFIICPFMVGLNFLVYNGKTYIFITVKQIMINYKMGEFLTTKILGSEIHLDKKKRKNSLS